MRSLADSARIERLMEEWGRVATVDGTIYLTGATAVLVNPTAQALSKAERGHVQDRQDIADLIASGLVMAHDARAQFEEIRPLLFRFPAIDPGSFQAAVEELFPPQG